MIQFKILETKYDDCRISENIRLRIEAENTEEAITLLKSIKGENIKIIDINDLSHAITFKR